MKTNIFKIAFLVFIATAAIASCSSSTEQKTEALEKAQTNVRGSKPRPGSRPRGFC